MAKQWLRLCGAWIAFLPILLFLAIVSSAAAANRIYWGNVGANTISYANLDGSGGGDLNTAGATVSTPRGVGIDAASGRIFWSNDGGPEGLFMASLDGGGGGSALNTAGATQDFPVGAAIDPAAGRIYWSNHGNNTISFANLNGSGGGDLSTAGATVEGPYGVAIDPGAGRIYWTNVSNNTISFANLDGTGGGGMLNTTGATVNQPTGPAIDEATGRIYWTNNGVNTISFANLDGSGGGDLNTAGVTPEGPRGAAIDPAAGRIYWTNVSNSTISFANLTGGGGGTLNTAAATVNVPDFPALLEAPAGSGVPAIEGGSSPGSVLSCSQGSWAPDLLGSFLYRAPRSISYQWLKDGQANTGATAKTLTATETGNYTCQVTATNAAGSASQTSAQVQVKPSNEFTIGKVKKTKLSLTLASAGSVRIVAFTRKFARKGAHPKPPIKPSTTSGGPGRIKIPLRLTGSARVILRRTGKLTFKATVTFTPTGGDPNAKTAVLKLRGHRKPR